MKESQLNFNYIRRTVEDINIIVVEQMLIQETITQLRAQGNFLIEQFSRHQQMNGTK